MDDVEVISVRSASAKRARSRDQATVTTSKRNRSSVSTSHRSISPRRDYPRGTSTVTRPSQVSPKHAEDRPVHAQGLGFFKADMTSLLADMRSSLSDFASQLKSSSGGQGKSESVQNMTSDQGKEPSDHADHSEGSDLAAVEDPGENEGDPKLENLMMTGEEDSRDFESCALASPSITKRKTLWKA